MYPYTGKKRVNSVLSEKPVTLKRLKTDENVEPLSILKRGAAKARDATTLVSVMVSLAGLTAVEE